MWRTWLDKIPRVYGDVRSMRIKSQAEMNEC